MRTLGRTSDCRTIFEKNPCQLESSRENVYRIFLTGYAIFDQCKLANYRQRTDVTPADENTVIVLTQRGMLEKIDSTVTCRRCPTSIPIPLSNTQHNAHVAIAWHGNIDGES